MNTRRTLTRNVKVGDTLTIDNGRIVIRLLERTGRNASRIQLDMDPDVVVNKPESASSDSPSRIEVRHL